ncbi:MAG: fumarylacetoacetate hydrolase family protein [Blastocatellia bacterium]
MTWFALATYKRAGAIAPAIVIDEEVYDLASVAEASAAPVPAEWLTGGGAAILANWATEREAIQRLGESVADQVARKKVAPVPGGVGALDAPLRPTRIFCAASNYVDHAKEMGTALAAKEHSKPYMFVKLQNSVIGPWDTVRKPPETERLDWEVELAVVISRRARRISGADALDYVAGYAVINDVSARDLTKRHDYPFTFDWFQGKCHDSFAPLGPWIVPSWLIEDPQKLRLRLTVNGEVMQDDSTSNMIWNVREQIAYLSTIVTLEPGDVIATGTPTGVGMGRGVFLKPGDVMEASIDGIGSIRNPVEAEQIRK